MRKAFTLVEMLVIIAIAPLMMVVVSRIFATFIRDIPRETRVVQQSTTILDMLGQVRRDVDEAVGLPERFADTVADERTLLIGRSDAVICYRFEDGRTVRTLLVGAGPRARPTPTPAMADQGQPQGVAPTETSAPNDQRIWRMPNAVITCRPWTRDGKAYAVEMHSHVQQRFAGTLHKKLANSQVFFVNGAGKGREVQ